MSSLDEARSMVNVFDADGQKVTGDLEPGDYILALDIVNLIAGVGQSASHAMLVLHFHKDQEETVTSKKVVQVSDKEESLEMPFSVDKWVDKIRAIALLNIGDEELQAHTISFQELEKSVTFKR